MSDGCKECKGCKGCDQEGSCNIPSKQDVEILKTIVKKHGGTISVDPDTGTFHIEVSEKNKAAMVEELAQRGI